MPIIFLMIFSAFAFADMATDLENFSPKVSMCSEEDLYHACAVDLCGPPNNHQSMTLRDYNFERFLSEEGMQSLPAVKADLEKLLNKKIAENLKLINDLKKKKSAGTLLPKFDSLSGKQWNDLAISVYQTHLGFNPFKYEGGSLKPNPLISSTVAKGLSEYAKTESCSTSLCREGIKDFLSEDLYGRKLEELALKANNPNLLKERLPYCLSKYASSVLKKDQHKRIEAELPRIYEKYIGSALAGFSKHSKEVFRDFLKNDLAIKYELPQKSAKEYLDEVHSYSQKSKIHSSELDQMLYYRKGKQAMDPLAELTSICPDSFYTAGGDLFSQGGWIDDSPKTALVISLASQLDPVSGEGVIFHELSHALSHLFSNGKMSKSSTAAFMKRRDCVKSLSQVDPEINDNKVALHVGDHKCTEEDAADTTSFIALGNITGPLIKCSLLKQSSDRTEYEKIDMIPRGDHSAYLVRILREAVQRDRKISDNCQKVMDQNKSSFNFKKCI